MTPAARAGAQAVRDRGPTRYAATMCGFRLPELLILVVVALILVGPVGLRRLRDRARDALRPDAEERRLPRGRSDRGR